MLRSPYNSQEPGLLGPMALAPQRPGAPAGTLGLYFPVYIGWQVALSLAVGPCGPGQPLFSVEGLCVALAIPFVAKVIRKLIWALLSSTGLTVSMGLVEWLRWA